MGAYINPTELTKEEWLEKFAEERDYLNPWDFTPPGKLPVVLVDNGLFTAAGICFDEREYNAFIDPYDFRPKRYFYVSIDLLMDENVSSLSRYKNRIAQ